MSKDKRGEKENFPPAPPLREKGERKESTTTRDARAMAPVVDIHHPPALDTLLWWATSRGYSDQKWIRRWYDEMANEFFWCYSKTGEPVRHWPALFRWCYRRDHAKSEKRPSRVRKADGWLEPNAATMEDFRVLEY